MTLLTALLVPGMLLLSASESRAHGASATTIKDEPPGGGTPLLLTTGEERIVKLDFNANAGANGVSIGNPRLVATTLVKIGTDQQLVLKPLAVGATTITVRDQDGTVKVRYDAQITAHNLLRLQEQLARLLQPLPGVEVRLSGTQVVIDGLAEDPAACGRAVTVATDPAFRDSVLYLVRLSPAYFNTLARKMEDAIHRFAPKISVRLEGESFWLEGTYKDDEQHRRATETAKLLLPSVMPADPLVTHDPGAQILPPRSLIQDFLKPEGQAGP